MAAAFSPDGARVLTTFGSRRKAARLWRTDTGELERELLGHTDWLTAAVFSADGNRVATAAQDGTVRLWDAATGESLRMFAGHVGAVFSVAFSPDGARVAGGGGSFDPKARVWDTRTGQLVRTFEEDAGHVRAVQFSPSGAELLVGWEGGLLRLFDVASGRLNREIVVPAGFLHTAMFSPDGAFILTGESFPFFTARLWDAGSGEELRVFFGHTAPVNAVAFNARGNWILTGGDNVRLWDISDLRARLRVARGAGGLELRWAIGALQQADTVPGAWTTVPEATSPWTVPLGRAAAFYRVAVPAAD
jgi:WD40 repeat protein